MQGKSLLRSLWSRPSANTHDPALIALPQPQVGSRVSASDHSTQIDRPLEAADVFIAGGRPSLTMIDRSQTVSFAAIAAQVRRRGRVISLHGESKSGKTILCLQIFRDKSPIEIHAREAKTLDAFGPRCAPSCACPSGTM